MFQETETTSDYLIDYHPFGRFVYTKAVICPFTYQPCYAFAAAEYPLAFLLADREFAVGQIIAYFFPAFHAEGNKCIACPPFTTVYFLC